MRGRLPAALNDNFQIPLSQGKNIEWKCRAGARHFEIDAGGQVHLCQPRTGVPAKHILDYNVEDILKHFYEEKSCSKNCPIAYAHLGSRVDKFRHQIATA